MSALAESSLEPVPLRSWLLRGLIVIIVIALLVGLALWIKSMTGAPAAAKRQTAKISILPDTPPPPPPPKEEKKPEPPKNEPKQAMREEQLKQDAPKPANEPIKMDGPAGDGPSAFAAGTVTNEYKGGAPMVGASGGTGGNVADRVQERFYANSVRQLLHDEIEKNLRSDAGELTATFSVWIEPDGSIRRFDLVPTGDAAHDTDLRFAFDQTTRRLRLPGHSGLPQPMRFKLSVRPA
ncbi:MAG: TonB-dependent receptor [Rhizobacter sp.]|nr:TonB-dependent receptor [Rhizobacter sp.]